MKAVIVGLLIDIGGSVAISAVLGFMYAIGLASQGLRDDEIAAALANIEPDSWLFIVGTLGGAVLSFAGGFVCARIARRSEYRLGFILAALSAVAGLALSWGAYPALQNVLLTLATAACVMLGTKYGRAANAA